MANSSAAPNNTVAPTRPSRTLKRTLKATVGVGLAVSAAVLLVRANEIGDWLNTAAINVMPHANAGAEIVQRAIEASKTCYQEGVNVCLDAEGRVTALCESVF